MELDRCEDAPLSNLAYTPSHRGIKYYTSRFAATRCSASSVTCSPKTSPRIMRVLRGTIELRRVHAQVEAHRGTDRGPAQGARGGRCCNRVVSPSRHQPADVLPLAEQVWWNGGERGATPEGARRGELAAQAARRGSSPGQPDAERSPPKKLMEPATRRDAVRYLRNCYAISERRACGLIGMGRSTLRYGAHPRDDAVLRQQLRALANRTSPLWLSALAGALKAGRTGRQPQASVSALLRGRLSRAAQTPQARGSSAQRDRRDRVCSEPTLEPRCPERCTHRWAADTLVDGRGYLHAGSFGDRGRLIPPKPAGGSRARPDHRRTRDLSARDRARQRTGAHQPHSRSMGLRPPGPPALHRPR